MNAHIKSIDQRKSKLKDNAKFLYRLVIYLTTPIQIQTLGHTASRGKSTVNGEFMMRKEATTADSKALL
jgi:hypothetical protein